MNDLFQNLPFLVAAWSAIIFLFFAVGLLIQNRRLRKKNAEDWTFIQEEKVRSAERIEDLKTSIYFLESRTKNLTEGAEYNFKRAEEAEEARQRSAESAAREICDMSQRNDLLSAAVESACRDHRQTYARSLLLGRLLSLVYPYFHFIHNDNEKIIKHLARLEQPKKRKSRAKAKA